MKTAAVDRNSIAEERWRLRIDTYAHRLSGGKWKQYAWVKHLLRLVQDKITEGGARIIINAPPRHGKSSSVSHYLPTWFLDHYPELRVILASYGDDFAASWGLRVRDEFEHNPLTWTKVRQDKSRASDWLTTAGGGMKTVGVGGALTGHGGNLLVADDCLKNWEEAQSKIYRKRLVNWFNSTFYTRAEPWASIVVVETRWHERDLTGYLTEEHEDDWIHIRFPALAELDDPLDRAVGEALCPERFDERALAQIRAGVTEMVFAGLYQQRPAPPEGGLIKRDWFRYWTELPAKPTDWLLSWDLAAKETSSGSYTVGQVWCRSGGDFYLVDQWRGRADFPTVLRVFGSMVEKWPQARTKLVEDAAQGRPLIETLRRKVPGIIAVPARGSKEARLQSAAPYLESGNVWLPARASWVDALVEEVVAFPNAVNDDQVDALSQALNRYKSVRIGTLAINLDIGHQENPWRI